MKITRTPAACFLLSIFATAVARAAPIEWVGDAGAGFFVPANWSDNVGPTPNVAYAGDIVISGGSPVAGAEKDLMLASGFTVSVTDSTIDFTGSKIVGVTNAATDAVFNVVNSTVITNSVALDAVFNLTDDSTLRVLGVNNTVNGDGTPTNNTRVNLSDGSKIIHGNGNGGAGGATVGQRIFRTATGTSFATDLGTAPLEEFTLTGPDTTPFVSPNDGTFTITAVDPNGPVITPEVVIGYRLVPPETSQVIWYPTFRTATDWQTNLDNPQIAFFGWAGITDVYVADLNGDGRDDKVMRQTADGPTTDPSQIIATYTTIAANGFTSSDFMGTAGDLDIPFGFLNAADSELVFGDLDGDLIEDGGVYFEAIHVGGTADQMIWGIFKSNNVPGISSDQGSFSNFVGWSAFGVKSLGDLGMLGDFNGDGIADRLIHRTTTNQVFIDLSMAGAFGNGTPDYGPIALGILGDAIHVSDINGDGKDDLVIARDTSATTPGLQTIYGYYNDGNGFASLNGGAPDIIDAWGVGEGLLFGQISLPVVAAPSAFQITQITSAGHELAFAGTFNAFIAGTYKIEASLNLQAPWQVMDTLNVASPGLTPFSISDAQLDTTFGPGTRSRLFIRVSQP